jgi:hypothetical protein
MLAVTGADLRVAAFATTGLERKLNCDRNVRLGTRGPLANRDFCRTGASFDVRRNGTPLAIGA